MVVPIPTLSSRSNQRQRSTYMSFLHGIAKNLGLSGSPGDVINYVRFLRQWSSAADALVTYGDWQQTGADIKKALQLYAGEQEESQPEVP